MSIYLSEYGKDNKAQQAIKVAKEAISLAEDQISEMTKMLIGSDSKPMPVKNCNFMGNRSCSVSYYKKKTGRYQYGDRTVKETCDKALEHANELLKKSKDAHELNMDAIANNNKLKIAVCNFMKTVGIPATYTTYSYKTNRSKTKTESTHRAGWVDDVSRVIITNDNFEQAEREYKMFIESISKYRLEETRKEEAEKKEKEEKLKKDSLVAEAIQYLNERNKKINDDYTLETAIKVANDIAFEEAVKEANECHDYIDFSGDDYCEDCKGWIAGEHRCQCGNRRVSFEEGCGHSFKEPYIEAVAY